VAEDVPAACRLVDPVEELHSASSRSVRRDANPDGQNGAVSPRASATAHELSQIGLLATLPGERLAQLAKQMRREDVPVGDAPVVEGDQGDRFYVVLAGMLTVSQEGLGARRVLRPGDYFGEVALAMDMPRTATVTAITPAVVASCDRATFDEILRPLFADDA
jgi:CRP-like cAMP-binding protein